jgi:hypothetical protein
MQLEDIGLITGVTGQLSNQIKDENITEANGQILPLVFNLRSSAILIRVRKPFSTQYRCSVLTRIGKELYPITRAPSTLDIAKAFAAEFPKSNVIEIVSVTLGPSPHQEILWSEPQQPQQ